jgi:phosphate transport system substrate-binding protein
MLQRVLSLVFAIALCSTSAFSGQALINGAGATFPYPIYSKWFSVYSKAYEGVQFNYQSIGSGGGIKQITAKTVDFGATDGPMTQEQLNDASGRIYHIPTVLGAVAIVYNLKGISSGLKISPDVLVGIFLGKITMWNDRRIVQDNPGINLPAEGIVVAHRSDGSGTSFIFTDYLSSVSSDWKNKVGKATSVNWPIGLGGKGNEGVAGVVKQTNGSIGYVELAYAYHNKMNYADVQNSNGNFVKPTLDATSKAAQGVLMPDDFRVSIVNSSNPEAYPISGFTWILIYKDMNDPVKGKAIVDFLKWAIHEGQAYAEELLYAPLPSDVVSKIDAKLLNVKY